MKNFLVSYSFLTCSGDLVHHSKESGPANTSEQAVEKVLKYVSQFVRDNLVSASAAEHNLNANGDLVSPRGYRFHN